MINTDINKVISWQIALRLYITTARCRHNTISDRWNRTAFGCFVHYWLWLLAETLLFIVWCWCLTQIFSYFCSIDVRVSVRLRVINYWVVTLTKHDRDLFIFIILDSFIVCVQNSCIHPEGSISIWWRKAIYAPRNTRYSPFGNLSVRASPSWILRRTIKNESWVDWTH